MGCSTISQPFLGNPMASWKPPWLDACLKCVANDWMSFEQIFRHSGLEGISQLPTAVSEQQVYFSGFSSFPFATTLLDNGGSFGILKRIF